MKALFRINCGHWSASVGKVKPGTFHDPNITLGAQFYFDRVRLIRYGYCPEFKHLARKRRSGPVPVTAYAELFGFSLSEPDREDFRFLLSAADALCDWVQQGGSVEGWCQGQGLRPVRVWKVPQDRTRPGPLAVHVKDKVFVLSP
jgi:hypothetical protein